MKKVILLLFLIPIMTLKAETFTLGIKGGFHKVSNLESEQYLAGGICASLKPPLVNFGILASVDIFGKKKEVDLPVEITSISTTVLSFDGTLIYNISFPLSSLYFGLGGGIQSWTNKSNLADGSVVKIRNRYTDVHGLLGVRLKPPLWPFGILAEVKFSKIFADEETLNDLNLMGGLFTGF